MKLKGLKVAGCIVVLGAVAVYSYVDSDGTRTIIAGAFTTLWLAIAAGIVVRLVRARRGTKIRTAFSPVAGAADTYQSLVLGRPTMGESSVEATGHPDADRFTSGP
ncbi:MAG: hypothetical protein WBX27_11810 [Specibacter sp.]